MVEIDVLLTETKLTEDFLSGLKQRYLAEKFFYWFPLSVKAWLDLCQSSQSYKNYSRSYRLINQHAAAIAGECPSREIEVVGLGAGQGDKDLLVLEALRSAGKSVRYRPVDSSQALLEIATARACEAGFQAQGLKADIEDPKTSDVLRTCAEEPRLCLLLGNSLGVIDPFRLLETLRNLLRPDDLLLVDGEIYRNQTTLQGYENPINRQFAFAPLASLGLGEGRDGSLIFERMTDARLEGLHLIGKHFQAVRRLRFPVAGEWIELQAGEKIGMNSSWKYSSSAFRRILREIGGFNSQREFPSDDDAFLMVLARRGTYQ